ncbi:hypothetical protein BP6252_13532 [Coleophoma cylindrospora]|uniref:Sur7 protein n=1 Tax=Coleophoma cylindrospora TaxID=1849047 RepID=A0A3D8Q8J7_9HELO|nr:hypothetical protein BP6252_13532 [Coleophoma cylindrospora]
MRFSALIPVACAMVAFVLSMLALFAGNKPGFMEDYNIMTLNTSTLGHVLVPTPTSSSSSSASSTSSSLGSFISSLAQNITNSIEGELASIEGDIADKLAQTLGISQWYSLHFMDMCQGSYAPNATAKHVHKNTTECSNQTAMYHFNLTQTLNDQLHRGGLNLNLSDINWPSEIQDSIDAANTAMDATFILFMIGIGAAGVSILAGLVAFLVSGSRLLAFGNWGLTTISFTALLITAIILTVVQGKFVHAINKNGNDIGIYAYRGTKYLIITWIAPALMFLASLVWVFEFCIGRKQQKREYTEKASYTKRSKWSRSRI